MSSSMNKFSRVRSEAEDSASLIDDAGFNQLLLELTEEELEECAVIDPDDTLMPPSQRCKEQTKKQPTGPYKREYLKLFLEVQAKKQEDWKETVAFEAGTKRGRIWIPKETTSGDVESEDFNIELDDENVGPMLKGAKEQDWIDLAGILGLHSLLNQTQYYNALTGKEQDPDDMSFTGIVKCMRPKKKIPEDEPNDTNLDDCIEKLNNNDESLRILNLNNLKEMLPRTKLKEILQAMCNNKNVKVFSLANTSCNDQDLEPLFDVLDKNDVLRSLNIESNFLSGTFLAELVGHLSNNKSLIELKAENQKSVSLGYNTEMKITEHVEQNDNLLRLGLSLRFMDSRHRIDEALERNYELEFAANVVPPAPALCPSTQNRRTAPDVPHAVDVYTIRCCTEGNGVGLFFQEPTVCPSLLLGALNNIKNCRDFNTNISSSENEKLFFENFTSSSREIAAGNNGGLNLASFFNVKLNNDGAVPIDFVFDTGDDEIRWETTLMAGRRLLFTVSSNSLSELTKESFVALLEMAEEKLGCREIYVEFPTSDESADRLRHTFFYLGFKPVPPSIPSSPAEEGYAVMVYRI